MCLRPVEITPKYREINPNGFLFKVPCKCNKCVECVDEKNQDFATRFYFDADYTMKQGGYVYLDTLTYNDTNLPKHYKIAHFNNEDVKRFKRNMEKEIVEYILKYHNRNKSADNYNEAKALYRKDFKILLVSEYGGDFHRPHYHLAIFNRIPEVNCVMVEYAVMHSWINSKGKRLGGVEARPCVEKVVKNAVATAKYLSKYLTKHDDYYESLRDRRKELVEKFGKDSKLVKKFDKLYETEFKPKTHPYQGFGSKLENYYKVDDLLVSNKVTIPDSFMVAKEVKVPAYTVRRLFKDRIRREDGTYKEVWNNNGIKFIHTHESLKFEGLKRFYKTIIDNIETYSKYIRYNDDIKDSDVAKYYKDRINSILGERTLDDFIEYILYYRGRYSEELENGENVNVVPRNIRINELLINPFMELRVDVKEFRPYVICENHNKLWKGFDKLYSMFSTLTEAFNDERERYYDTESKRRNRLRKAHKLKFINCGIK